jgi:hypothetical protein
MDGHLIAGQEEKCREDIEVAGVCIREGPAGKENHIRAGVRKPDPLAVQVLPVIARGIELHRTDPDR